MVVVVGFVLVRLAAAEGKGGDDDKIYMIGLGFYANWARTSFFLIKIGSVGPELKPEPIGSNHHKPFFFHRRTRFSA